MCLGTYVYAIWLIQKRIRSNYPEAQARVIKCKKLPSRQIHPSLPQKTYCWLSMLQDDTDIEFSCSTTTKEAPEKELADEQPKDTEQPAQSREELMQELREWSSVPCVLTDNTITLNNTISVILVDGDTMRPLYIPYQKQTIQRMIRNCFWGIPWIVGSILLLYVSYDAPIMFARSADLEESINASARYFWSAIGLDDDDMENEDDSACRIPRFVAAGYDFMLIVLCFIPIVMGARVRQLTRQFARQADTPDNAYQLLSNNDDDQEENNAPMEDRVAPSRVGLV